jgi:hypothetical protein
MNTTPNPQALDYPRLFIKYIRSYPPYLEAPSVSRTTASARSEFLAADPEVPGSILGVTRFPE